MTRKLEYFVRINLEIWVQISLNVNLVSMYKHNNLKLDISLKRIVDFEISKMQQLALDQISQALLRCNQTSGLILGLYKLTSQMYRDEREKKIDLRKIQRIWVQ